MMTAIARSDLPMLVPQNHEGRVLRCCSKAQSVGCLSATATVVVALVASLASFRPTLASMIRLE